MKLTNSVLRFIEQWTLQFSKQLTVEPPLLWFKTKEVLDAPIEHTRGRRTSAYKYLGVTYQSLGAVFLNIRRMKKRKQLKYVIAHELIHYRFPYLSHGDKFEQKVKQIVKGKQFPAYRGKEKIGSKE